VECGSDVNLSRVHGRDGDMIMLRNHVPQMESAQDLTIIDGLWRSWGSLAVLPLSHVWAPCNIT
jgi:hypothetical protein